MIRPRKILSIAVAVALGFSFILPHSVTASAENADAATITNLKTEDIVNPVGIDTSAPRFSWQMESNITGECQTSYQILVATSQAKLDANNGDAWDSGVVGSSLSNNIAYSGSTLQARQRYYWKVNVWDQDGVRLSSGSAFFEMGLLDKSQWDAKFIAFQGASSAQVPAYTIEAGFRIETGSAGIVFGYKDGNCLMWQVNDYNYASQQKVYLRPHRFDPNGTCEAEIDISNVIPWAARSSEHTMTISVSSSNVVTTRIDGIQVDQRTESLAGFGQLGFREFDGTPRESSFFTGLSVKNDENGASLLHTDFSTGGNPFGIGQMITNQTTGVPELYLAGTGVTVCSVDGSSAPMFRKNFSLLPGKTVQKARLYASALGVYDAYLNGTRVSDAMLSPGDIDFTKFVMYQTYDITSLLSPGNNTVGAIVGDGWYSGHVAWSQNIYGTDVAFLGQVEVTYTDGTRQVIGTDSSWKVTKNGPYLQTDNLNGETYDATREMPGWSSPGFSDGAWNNALPATKSSIRTNVDIDNIRYVAQVGPLVTPQDEFAPKSITQPSPGTYIIDLGQNIAGVARITIRGGKAGDTIRLRYSEMLYDQRAGSLAGTLYTANLLDAAATDHYTKNGDGAETYQPRFTFHGFQYIEVTGYPGELQVDDIRGVFIGSETTPSGTYSCSNAMVNQLFSNLTWSQRDNFLSIPTDCPQRNERLGWTGDAQIFCRTASYNMDVKQFFEKYAADLRKSQAPNGAPYDVAPYQGFPYLGSGDTGWADVVVIVPWTMYLVYGDTKILSDNYEMMQKFLAYCQTEPTASEPYIIPDCRYGDWLAVTPTGNALVSTAYFAYSASLMSKAAAVLGKTADAAAYEQLFENIRAAFDNKFVDMSTGKITENTQTAYLLALKFNLLPTKQLQDMAAQNLVNAIAAANYHLTTGFLGVNALCPVLTQYGYGDIAYRLLLNTTYPSWGYEVLNGATTIWERWNSYSKEEDQNGYGFNDVNMNSFNHYSYGSIGEWMYRYSAGIEADENAPAYKNIIFQPSPGGDFTYVNSSYNSAYGTIQSNWTRSGSNFSYSIRVPANSTGTVKLPANSTDSLMVNGRPYTPGSTSVEGVTYVGFSDKTAEFQVASGSYSFGSTVTDIVRHTVNVSSGDSLVSGKAMVSVNGGTETSYNLPFSAAYPDGTNLSIRVIPSNDVDYEFSGWAGDASGIGPICLTLAQDRNYTAQFSFKGHTDLALGKSVAASDSYEAPPTWAKSNLTDGLFTSTGGVGQNVSGYTSNGTASPNLTGSDVRTITIDLGAPTAFNTVQLYPRTDAPSSDGLSPDFPVDFKIEASNSAGFDDISTLLVNQTGYTNPGTKPAVFSFTETTARYVRLTATRLGDKPSDDAYWRLQLAEIGVYNVKQSDSFTLKLDKIANGTVMVNGTAVTLPFEQQYAKGARVGIEAAPSSTSTFVSWSGPIISQQQKLSVVMNDDISLTAKFQSLIGINFAHGKPVAASDSLSISGTWGPSLLTDGIETGTGFSSDTASSADTEKWVEIDLGQNYLIDTIKLFPRSDSSSTADGKAGSFPRDFTLQTRLDGQSTGTPVVTVTGLPTPAKTDVVSYTLAHPVFARYVRLDATELGAKPTDDSFYRLQLAEMEVYNNKYVTGITVDSPANLQKDTVQTVSLKAALSDGSTMDLTGCPIALVSTNTSVAVVNSSTVTITSAAQGVSDITADVIINGVHYQAFQRVFVDLDFASLDTEIENARALDGTAYTPASWANLQAALTDAAAVPDRPSLSQSDIDTAVAVLHGSIDSLVPLGPVSSVCVMAGTTAAQLLERLTADGMLPPGADASVYDASGSSLSDNAVVGTGTRVIAGSLSVQVVVTGDLNGDGEVNATDLLLLKRHLLGMETLQGAFMQAANIDHDTAGQVSAADLLLLKRFLLGLAPLS